VSEPLDEQERDRRTSYLELFFDLVFVFAVTEVTSLMRAEPTAGGYARAVLVLWLVWWAWGGYAWMTNAIELDGIAMRAAFLLVTLGCFLVALGVAGAYGDDVLWFTVPYLVVRVAHVALYVAGLRGTPDHQAAIRRLAPWFLVAPAVVLAGSFVDGDARWIVWAAAAATDIAGALDVRNEGFRVGALHFAERYALFIIIALGESIVAIGVGAGSAPRNGMFAASVAIAFGAVTLFWWAYFEHVVRGAERALRRLPLNRRGPMARDIYSFLHFPFVAGIVFWAVAAEQALEHAGRPLPAPGRWALGIGIAVYLLGSVAGRLRAIRAVAWERAAGAVASVVAAATLTRIDAVWLMAVGTGILAAVVLCETLRLHEDRSEAPA
jgi:low temperature requirement protein LtrA